MRNSAIAIEGNGQNLSAAFAQFGPTLTEFDQLFRVLDTQQLAVRALFRNGATALQAFRGRNGQLADLIQSSNAVFQTTAAREQDIEALFKAFPTFLDEFRTTLDRLRVFSVNTDPLMRQLVPAAEELSPTLIAIAKLSPEAEGFFKGLLPVIDESSTGFPALRKLFRDQFPPLLRAADPFLRNLNPVITSLGQYKRELAASMANVAAATNALHIGSNEKQIHYLRVMGPFTPDSLATLPTRRTSNRTSAYIQPGSSKSLATGLLSFETRQCGSSFSASLNGNTPNEKAFNERTEGRRRQSERLLPPPAAIRLRQPGQHDDRPGPRLQLTGPVRTDLRQRPPGDHLPAHLRTGRLAPGALDALAEGGEDDPGGRRRQREQLLDRDAGDVGDGQGRDHEAVSP